MKTNLFFQENVKSWSKQDIKAILKDEQSLLCDPLRPATSTQNKLIFDLKTFSHDKVSYEQNFSFSFWKFPSERFWIWQKDSKNRQHSYSNFFCFAHRKVIPNKTLCRHALHAKWDNLPQLFWLDLSFWRMMSLILASLSPVKRYKYPVFCHNIYQLPVESFKR